MRVEGGGNMRWEDQETNGESWGTNRKSGAFTGEGTESLERETAMSDTKMETGYLSDSPVRLLPSYPSRSTHV